MSYVYPCATTAVSDSFADHVERGSVNPGTDYTAPYGSRVVAVAAGTVTDADGSPAGSGGRTVHVDHDDGTGADYLHLSGVSVSRGDRVAQGQTLGYSGASGVPDSSNPPRDINFGYGPHLHISFRRNHAHGYGNVGNIDFDALMRSQTTAAAAGNHTLIPTNQEDDMPVKYEIIAGKNDRSGTHYVSFNRAGRYPLSKQSEADYQYWLKNELGYSPAEVAVKVVDTLESFGPVLRDAKP